MQILLAALAFLFCCPALYPDIQFYDSGELATAAVYLGYGHSPGQPLYSMLSHTFLWIPFGSLGFRLCLFSLACTVLSLLLLQKLMFDFFARSRSERLLTTLLLAGFSLHAFVHEQSGRIELYSLQMLLACAALYGAFRSRLHPAEGLGISLGAIALSALTHPLLGIVLTPAVLPALRAFTTGGRGRAAWVAMGAALPALLLLLYPALRSHAVGAWLSIDGISEWFQYVTGSMYAGSFSAEQPHLFDHVAVIVRATLPFLLVTAAGIWLRQGILREIWMPLALMLAALLPATLQRSFLPGNLDYHGYLLPVAVMALVAAGASLVEIHRRLEKRRAGAAVVCGLSFLVSWITMPAALHTHVFDQRAPDVAYRIADDLPREPVMVDLALDTTLVSVSYLRDVAGVRPDVLVLHPIRLDTDTMRQRALLAGFRIPDKDAWSRDFRKVMLEKNQGARFFVVSPPYTEAMLGMAPAVYGDRDILYEPGREGPGHCPALLADLRRPAYHPQPMDSIEELPVTGLAFRKFSYDLILGRFGCAGKAAREIGKKYGMSLDAFSNLEDTPSRPDLAAPFLRSKKEVFFYDRARFLLLAAELAFVTGRVDLGSQLCLESYRLGRSEAAELAVLWAKSLGRHELLKVFLPLLDETSPLRKEAVP